MFGIFTSFFLAGFITCALLYLSRWKNNGRKKVVKKMQGKANEPIEFHIQDANLPVVSGWPLHLLSCIYKWKFTGFLKNILMDQTLRLNNFEFLRQMSIPDPPTFFPQVLPNSEQQLHQESDLKTLLKKPEKEKEDEWPNPNGF